jgi:hypothetical protein
MEEEITKGRIVGLLKLAREMDECCNLAAELVGHSLKSFNFWTTRVLDIYRSMGRPVGGRRNGKGFTIFL